MPNGRAAPTNVLPPQSTPDEGIDVVGVIGNSGLVGGGGTQREWGQQEQRGKREQQSGTKAWHIESPEYRPGKAIAREALAPQSAGSCEASCNNCKVRASGGQKL